VARLGPTARMVTSEFKTQELESSILLTHGASGRLTYAGGCSECILQPHLTLDLASDVISGADRGHKCALTFGSNTARIANYVRFNACLLSYLAQINV